MTLALRLLVAFGLLALVATGLVGIGVRAAWRTMEEQHFEKQLEDASNRALEALDHEALYMRNPLGAVCGNAFVDQTLLDLERHELDQGRRLALSQIVPQQMKDRRLDEILLFTGAGEILGAGPDPAATGKIDRTLVAEFARKETIVPVRMGADVELAPGAGPIGVRGALMTRCIRQEGGQGVGLLGARHLRPILDQSGGTVVKLSITKAATVPRATDEETKVVDIRTPEFAGLRLVASISRNSLVAHLATLDDWILKASVASVLVAIVVAILLARSQARPIEELARQAREVVRGEPRRVEARGGKELEEFARAFNQAIEDLSSLRKRLATTERIAARREIARQVAHEIKNPLAPIRAAVETLRRLRARQDPAFDEYFDEATRTVLDEVFRITKIVSEFTEFARLPPPRPAPLELDEVARGVVGLYQAGGARITLSSSPCPSILADRDQLVQVLTNLIQNGLEAGGGDGAKALSETARVSVRVEPSGADRVAVIVADDGPGVSPEMLPRLFEPYATSKPNGTGLGLAIVQRIVQEHGGEITYEKPGFSGEHAVEPPLAGAVFRIVLPVAGPTLLTAPQDDDAPSSLQSPRG
jgi:two-component system nitrogen regulation sensor histidine kinase NtrY